MLEHADTLSSELPETKPKLKRSAELFSPRSNPLLHLNEKIFILLLTRGTSFSISDDVEKLHTRGISPESENILKSMVLHFNGSKKTFSQVVNDLNAKNTKDSPLAFSNMEASTIIETIQSGVKGDLDTVIFRANEGKANCLEFSLVMQLIAEIFYSKEVADAQLLAFTEYSSLFSNKEQKSRHFYLFAKRETESGPKYFLTMYGGRERELTREEAVKKAEQAATSNQRGVENIYRGFVTLIDSSEK